MKIHKFAGYRANFGIKIPMPKCDQEIFSSKIYANISKSWKDATCKKCLRANEQKIKRY